MRRLNKKALLDYLESDAPQDKKREVAELVEAYDKLLAANPLEGFEPHSTAQREFFEASTPVQAAFAGNRFGKCQKSDTPVRMADGSVRTIGAIHPGDWVLGVDLDGNTEPARVLAWYDRGEKDVYRFRFSKRGAEAYFDATLDHKMLARPECSANRVIPAGEVTTRWVAQRALGFDPGPSGDPDEEHALLVGLLLGDGCTGGRVMAFTCAEKDIEELAREEAGRLECALSGHVSNPIQFRLARRGPQHTPNPVRLLAERLGFNCGAHDKAIPRQAFKWGNDAVARLLAGLFLTDGCVTVCDNVGRVGFYSVSEGLVAGVKRLLEDRFGVYGSTVTNHTRKDKRTEYAFSVGNYASMRRFAESVPLIGRKRDRLAELVDNWPGKRSDGAGLIFRDATYLGKAATCDIQIDNDSHLFALANGLVVSNSTSMVVKALIHCCDLEAVPEHLRQYRYPGFKRTPPPCSGRIVVPGQSEGIYDVILPVIRRWAPKDQLVGSSVDKAFDKQHRMLRFKNGSSIQFMTYEMDLDKFGGPAKHFIAYDEPPPEDIREECLWRLADYAGFEMFAMTPLGLDSNAGWINKRIYKKSRTDPTITIVSGSIHDNPLVDEATKNRILESRDPDDPVRLAREFGRFEAFGGLIFDDGFENNLVEKPTPEQVKQWEVLVGIDPGIRNAGLVWIGFDQDNVAFIFDAVLLKNETPVGYAKAIRQVNGKWGVDDPLYVIDPAARARAQVNAESVEGELQRQGIYCAYGQNDVDAGLQQVRDRLRYGHLYVSRDPENRGLQELREEAEDYRAEQRPDGETKVVKMRDHLLDCARYCCLQRPYRPPEKPVKQVARPWGVATPPPRVHEAVAPTGSMT